MRAERVKGENNNVISAKQFLRKTEIITRRIRGKEQLIRRRREQAEQITAAMSGMPGSGNKGESRVEQAVTAFVDMEAEIQADIEQLRDLQRETMWMIGEMEDQRSMQILEERYLNGYLWPAIARHVHVSVDYVFKLHRKALREFGEIYRDWKIGQ